MSDGCLCEYAHEQGSPLTHLRPLLTGSARGRKFENGATLYIPGSNKWERRQDIAKNAKEMLKPFEAKAGSIVVMDGTEWHTSGANTTKD